MSNRHNEILKELQDIIERQDGKNKKKNIKHIKNKSSNNTKKFHITQAEKVKLLEDINDVIDCLKPIIESL